MWTKKDIPQSDGSIFPYGIVAWSWNHLYIMGVVSGAVFDPRAGVAWQKAGKAARLCELHVHAGH